MFKPSKIAILLFSGVALTLIFICPQSRNYFFELVGLFQSLDIDKIKEYILSFGVLAPLISFLLMVFQAILAPLPAFLITFAHERAAP
jgi:uncharacterized membrane protein YdjX (TVP38/TMEM64 family)